MIDPTPSARLTSLLLFEADVMPQTITCLSMSAVNVDMLDSSSAIYSCRY